MSLQWWVRFSGGGVAVPALASADEAAGESSAQSFSSPGLAAAYYPDEMTKFVFGEPGELTVDASHGVSAFPVPTKTLVFESDAAYLEFMAGAFNAKVGYDPETGMPTLDLQVVTLGIPYASDDTGTKLIPVENNPVDTFMGGPEGYFLVGDRVVCTDRARCPFACLPRSPDSEVLLDVQAASSVSLSTLGEVLLSEDEFFVPTFLAESFQGHVNTVGLSSNAAPQAPAGFSIRGDNWRTPIFGAWADWMYTLDSGAETRQSAGFMPYEVTWCGPPKVTKSHNGIVEVTYPQACSTVMVNPNELTLDVAVFTIDQTWCEYRQTAFIPRTRQNVPRIAWHHKYLQSGGVYTNSGVKTYHAGRTMPNGAILSNSYCWGAGCFTADPCK